MMNNFFEIVSFLPEKLQKLFIGLTEEITENTYEIRMRINRPLILYGRSGVIFINKDTTYSYIDYTSAYIVSETEINETVASICKYSVYSHQNDIINGFITFGNGNRAGFSGNAVVENGKIKMINSISSINIRVASMKYSLPDKMKYLLDEFKGIIIAGPPCSGKTTLLKAIAESVSSRYEYGFRKTVIVDERYEMQNICGINCDILSGYPKAKGIEHAVRTLSPEVIICDETSTSAEMIEMAQGMHCGVSFIISMHLSTIKDIGKSPLLRNIMNLQLFDYIVLLKNGTQTGEIDSIFRTEDIQNDNHFFNKHSDSICSYCLSDNTQ